MSLGVPPAATFGATTAAESATNGCPLPSARRAIIAASGSPFRRRARTSRSTSPSAAVAKSALPSSPPLMSTKREFGSSALRLLVTTRRALAGSVVASTFTTCVALETSQKLYLPSASVIAEVPSSR